MITASVNTSRCDVQNETKSVDPSSIVRSRPLVPLQAEAKLVLIGSSPKAVTKADPPIIPPAKFFFFVRRRAKDSAFIYSQIFHNGRRQEVDQEVREEAS